MMRAPLVAAIGLACYALVSAPVGHADDTCGQGNFYDPTHQICAPYPPAYPQPGYPTYPGYGGGYPGGYGGSCFSFNGFLFSYSTCS